MKLLIPKNLPQFSDSPSLFISAGEYEARFYLAYQGIVEELESFKIPPLSEDLKKKFQAQVDYTIHSLLDEYQFPSIYLFAPKYVAQRIVKGLEPNEEERIKIKFFGEFTKLHPLELLKMFWKQIELLISVSIMPPVAKEGEEIPNRPKVRQAIRNTAELSK